MKKGISFFLAIVMLASIVAFGAVSSSAAESECKQVGLESTGNSTFDAFINDPKWTAGVSWWGDYTGGKGPEISPYGSSGCGAYAADFAKYCFGKDSPKGGEAFYNVNEVRAGDVIHIGYDDNGHWLVILKRSGNSLYTAEGNYGGVVRIGWNYSISGSKFAEDSRHFDVGYHFSLIDDKTGPVVTDFHVGELVSGHFTVMAHVTDNLGVSSVRYAVWTEKNGQDDIQWYNGVCTDNNDYYWIHVNYSDHNNEKGKYIVHLYAYDLAGNLTNHGISYDFDSTGPTFTDFHIGEFRTGAFTVLAKVTDTNGVSSVRYAVWTEKNGQDDIKWYDGICTDNNDYYWARVDISQHNNEKGKYIIHMYAYDTAGKLTNPGIVYDFGTGGPVVTDFHVGELVSGHFTVMSHVTDILGVSSVRYAVWTEKNGQDDIKWYDGVCTDHNDYYWVHVNYSDHNNEKGKYIIHLYAYDSAGNLTNPGITYDFSQEQPTEPKTIILGDVDGDEDATVLDATYIQRYVTFVKVPFTDEQMQTGDVDGDGDLTVVDATFIQRHATLVPVPYPIGGPVTK